ncbi:hypothetical protein B0H14DRAFT_3002093 [Mycena olivaceomarginata]|nr:hypothetical protein B0H14DRAFT_3002093 [Mycena olivaceomarginata]
MQMNPTFTTTLRCYIDLFRRPVLPCKMPTRAANSSMIISSGRLRLEIERSWTGFRSSEIRKVTLLPEEHYCSKAIPNSDYNISASGLSTIVVQSSTDDYLQDFPYFAFDQGYLAFPGHMVDTIDVWREASLETLPFSPSPSQKVVAEASAAVYGSPTAGHFIPCYTLSPIEEAQINFKCLKMMYPTLLSATPATIHVWDISTGQHLRSLSTKRELDDHPMYHFTGIEISSSHVLAFDECQIRLAVAIQLLPPRHPCSLAQQDASALLPQVLFAKKNAWEQVRGGFYQGLESLVSIFLCLLLHMQLHFRHAGQSSSPDIRTTGRTEN